MLAYTELQGINNAKTLESVKGYYDLNQKFVIQEKIHGSNVSFRFDGAENPMTVHSRRQQITEHDKFFGIQAVLPKYKVVEERIKDYMRKNKNIESFYIFGEYFGPSVQSGINYGNEKRILFFDIYINEELVDYVTFEKLQKEIGIEDYCVKPLAVVENFEEAIKFDIGFNSTLSNLKSNNLCEGIVIKQYQVKEGFVPSAAINTDDDNKANKLSLLMCKLKNEKFLETAPKEKEQKEKKSDSAKTTLMNYINVNRIESYISKIANIDDLNDIHLDNIIEDALKDYLIDSPDYKLDEATKKICKTKIQGLYKKMKMT